MSHSRVKYKAPARRKNENLPFMDQSVDSDRNVNDLLHKLRGEQFRHHLNLSRTAPSSSGFSRNASLPYSQIFGPQDQTILPRSGPPTSLSVAVAGHAGPIPRSWLPSPTSSDPDYDSPEWRSLALSIFLAHAPQPPEDTRIPSLTALCVRALIEYYGVGEDALMTMRPFLPLRARQVLLRCTAISMHMERSSLSALLGPSGHVGGEAIFVGPAQAKLLQSSTGTESQDSIANLRDWDVEDIRSDDEEDTRSEDVGLSGVAIIGAKLRGVQILPRSLTRLALVHLPAPVPVHLLPDRCPMIEVLDLSFNDWLGSTLNTSYADRNVRWQRWARLRVLGIRGTGLRKDSDELETVNEGRWLDGVIVEIIV